MLGSIFCSSALKMFTVNKWKLLFQKLLRKKGLNSYHFDCSNFNKANDDLSVPKKCPKFPIESIGCQMKKRREGQYDRKSTRSPKFIRIARGGVEPGTPAFAIYCSTNYAIKDDSLQAKNFLLAKYFIQYFGQNFACNDNLKSKR